MPRIAKRTRCGALCVCGGLLLAACTASVPPSYTIQATGSGGYDPGPDKYGPPIPADPLPPHAPPPAQETVPSWSHDVATAGLTVGGMEAMQRLKDAQAGRAAAKLPPAPVLPAPAVEGAAGAVAEKKLAGNLLTREGAAVAERRAVERAAEKVAAGLVMRGAVVVEEGEGLWWLLRLLLFL